VIRHGLDNRDLTMSKIPPFTAASSSACCNIVERLRHWAEERSDAVAFTVLLDGEETATHLTYGDLDRRGRAIAAKLTSLRLRGERAVLSFPPGLDFICAFVGCLYGGVVPVPAYPPRRNRNIKRIRTILDDAEAKVALSNSAVISRVQRMLGHDPFLGQLPWLAIDEIASDLADEWEMPSISDESLAFLQYTSGSTSDPRGVMVTHANMKHNSRLIAEAFELSPSTRTLNWLPTHHDMGLFGGVIVPLFVGCSSMHMSPMAVLQKPARWLNAITRYGITVSGGPDFVYALCNESITPEQCERLDLRTWEVAFNGAEPVRSKTLNDFTEKFGAYGFRGEAHYPCYGMAENSLIIAGGSKSCRPEQGAFDGHSLRKGTVIPRETDKSNGCLVSCGRALGGQLVKIVDPATRALLSDGGIGEIWVQGASVGKGYWNQSKTTEETFHAHPSDGAVGPFLRTGDLGFIHNGELFVTGRLKDLIIIRGVNHYPQDIEMVAENTSKRLRPRSAAAFTVDDERLIVVCEVDRYREENWHDVIEEMRRAVTFELDLGPNGIILVRPGTIPKTTSGKIRRQACRNEFLEGTLQVVAQWQQPPAKPSNGKPLVAGEDPADGHSFRDVHPEVARIVLRQVRTIARERAADLHLDSNLVVDLGLDSLERLQVANSLEEVFGGRFPEEVLGQIETCREIARAIEDHIGVERIARQHNRPPSVTPSNVEVPESYYRIEEMPEYASFIQNKRELLESEVRNPFFSIQDGISSDTTAVDGRELINFSSFNYLGMSGHPAVHRAAKDAIDRFGTSVSASRLVSGEKEIHGQLEQAIAEFLGTEDALVFPAGHSTNESTIGHLFGPGDLILHDSLAHNSIIMGAKLSGASRQPFPHNDWRALDEILTNTRREFRRVLIAIEGLYSMDGDYPDLPRFIEVKHRHKAIMLVDEAHSIGTLGNAGRGIAELFGVPVDDVDLWMGTLSKALGSSGGFIAGGQQTIEYLKYTTPAFVFSSGITPASAAAALAALDIIRDEPQRVRQLQTNSKLFFRLAEQRGLNTGLSKDTPIISIITGDSWRALQLSERLFTRGISAYPIIHPAVEQEKARVRFFISSKHTGTQISTVVDSIAKELPSIKGQTRLGHGCIA